MIICEVFGPNLLRGGGEPFFEVSLRGGEEIFDITLRGGEEIFYPAYHNCDGEQFHTLIRGANRRLSSTPTT